MPIRITGGRFRGRNIPGASGRIRPTAARIRQALFDILGDPTGLSFCDLYAGTGAVGIEAASRGASFVEFVESDRVAARRIERTVSRLDLPPKAVRIRPVTVSRWLSHNDGNSDIIFADPPYLEEAVGKFTALLPKILMRLDPGGILILQLSAALDPPEGFTDSRRFGDDVLYFWQMI